MFSVQVRSLGGIVDSEPQFYLRRVTGRGGEFLKNTSDSKFLNNCDLAQCRSESAFRESRSRKSQVSLVAWSAGLSKHIQFTPGIGDISRVHCSQIYEAVRDRRHNELSSVSGPVSRRTLATVP